jgi:hypothetical protein
MATTHLADDVSYDLGRDDLELMNLVPADTGLPLTVWVGPRGGARHDVRVKVCMVPGDRMIADETAVVAVRPRPRLLHGRLSPEEFTAVSRWIALNEDLLVDYWEGRITSRPFAAALRTID